MPEGISSIKLV